MSTAATNTDAALGRAQGVALIAGLAGVGVCLLGLVIPGCTPHFFRAWLVGFNLFTGAAVGSLVVLMLQYLTGGHWGLVLRRTLEAGSRTLPLMAVLFLPIVFGMDHLYEWSRFERVHNARARAEAVPDDPLYRDVNPHDHELEHKLPYLNRTFFYVRAAIYFGVWCLLMVLLTRWSDEMDRTRDAGVLDRAASLSAPGLVLYVITVTFASIDWGMSLEPHWFSTIYGAMFGMGQVLTAFAVCVTVVLVLLPRRLELQQALSVQTMSDLGTLLGAFVMIWAYLGFMQFIIIWMAHLPEELPWYAVRVNDPKWRPLALMLVVFHFAVPFALLMSFDIKRNRTSLVAVGLLICVMRVIDLFWLLLPAFDHAPDRPATPAFAYLIYPAAVVGVGGLWFAVFLWQLGRRPLLPAFVPEEAVNGAPAH